MLFTVGRFSRPLALALGLLPSAFHLPPSAFGADSPRLVAAGTLPADTLDLEGETLGGLGSGLAYDAAADRFLAVADRGPGDGTVDFRPRFHVLKVTRDAEPGRLAVSVERTVVFRDPDGRPYTGLTPDDPAAPEPRRRDPDGRRCLDPEAIVAAPDGTVYVSDEYGPAVIQFKRDGTFLRRLVPSDHYLPRKSDGTFDFGGREPAVGRGGNQGFEGLAVSPDGQRLTAMLQGGLVQDGGRKTNRTRLLVFDVPTGRPVHEFVLAYETPDAANARLGLPDAARLKPGDLGGTDLLALSDGTFLLLERDGRGLDGSATPRPATAKGLWRLEVHAGRTTDLLARPRPADPAPPDAVPVHRVGLLVDLVNAPWRKFAPDWPDLSEKWEGLALRAFAGNADRFELLVAADNDFLHPTLRLEGRNVPFPKARQSVDTQFLLFEVNLPPKR